MSSSATPQLEPPASPRSLRSTPVPVVRRYDVERSCIRCHERKVRCDKKSPCVTCVRAKTPCRYPGPERAKRRSQKSSSVRVGSRLEVLERAVAAIHDPGRSAELGMALAEATPPRLVGQGPSAPLEHSGGLLLKDGVSTRYINEFIFSRVLDKQSELQSAINTPESNSSHDKTSSTTTGFDGLLSNPLISQDVLSLFPSRWQATQLWQSYLNNVDVLLKLLHIPSVQPKVFATISDPAKAALDMTALLFSIFYAAVTSLRAPDVLVMLGRDRQAALDAYQRGLEVSFHGGNFLDSPTLVSLQAMAIFLMCRRHHNTGQSGWILNGLLIRAAQSVGLHRDGGQFNLTPLEVEVRRRLWWQILGSDGRAAEDHGLSAGPTGGFDGFSDTKLPTHVDDRDLSPTGTIAPVAQHRWTDMTHFLVATEMYQSLQQINRISAQTDHEKMARMEQLLVTVKDRIETQYLQYCDSNIPIQKCALLLGRLLLGKSDIFVRQQHLRGLSAEESAARATDEMLTLACTTIELGIEIKTDELLHSFQWLFSTFTDYHLLTYILWHLCVQPKARDVEHAWAVVEKVFMLVETQGWPTPGSKWNVLCKLKEKAVDIRRAHHVAARTVDVVDHSAQAMPAEQMDQTLLSAIGTTPFFTDGMVWDIDSLIIPDWGGYPSEFA